MERRETDAWNSWEDLILVSSIKRNGLDAVDIISADVQKQAETRPPVFFTPKECLRRFEILRQKCLAISKTYGDNVVHEISIQFMKEELTKIAKQELREGIKLDNKEIRKLEQKLKIQRKELEGKNTALEAENEVEEEEEAGRKLAEEEVMVEVNVEMDTRRRLKMNEVVMVEVIEEEEINRILAVKANEKDESGTRMEEDRETVTVEAKEEKEEEVVVLEETGVNEPDPAGEKGHDSSLIDKRITNRVLKRLQRRNSSKLLYQKLHDQKNTESYQKMIREHIDLDIIQSKVNQKEDAYSFNSFFRDLLLVFNNAIVFFDKDSEEHITAIQLREVVRKEMDKLNNTVIRGYVIALAAPSSSFEVKFGRGRRNA